MTDVNQTVGVFRGPNRPLHTQGGGSGYLEKSLAAVAQPFKGITTDGAVIPGLFQIQKTGLSTESLRAAADDFLGSLNPEQRAKTLFPMDTIEWRKWSNIHPTLMRHGMPVFEMSDGQRDKAFALLRESLSGEGFQTARDVMRLNETVLEMTGRLAEYGEDLYWLSMMGTPSPTEPWGWQIDGHHLNINFFVLGDQVVMTPAFLGSEPVFAQSGRYAGTKVFRADENQGLSVIRALSVDQRAKAILSPEPSGEVFTSAFRDNLELNYQGIRYDELSSSQHDLLLRLVELHVGRMRPDHAQVKMAEVKRHLDETSFCWMGGIENDSVFYYRVQSQVIIIEFDHQRGIAFRQYAKPYKDHIHVVLRTPNGNDYGKDLLRQHYEQSHRLNRA
ncbi:MAG TPA: DUF3500 domain-containing protein [Candidatus Bathyarchaeia archaeon]|nr:DUF3500 domain-containing protein [Candidatus Bathyarchaeia archaeon]